MLMSRDETIPLLRCPSTLCELIWDRSNPGRISVKAPDKKQDQLALSYRVINGVPILIDFEDSIMNDNTDAASPVVRRTYAPASAFLRRLTKSPQDVTGMNIDIFVERLKRTNDSPVVLVVGGGIVGNGVKRIYDDVAIKVIAFDVYASEKVQFVADAHKIPLATGTIDGVIVQAVLEHVLCPGEVVDEILRVLRNNGLVYAETPFLQHVHEGPFDFTRFTNSGHRYLFKDFEELRAGFIGGPGTQLLWSIDYFVRGVCRSRSAGKLAKLALFWLRYFDLIIPTPYSIDAASGFYFLGKKGQTPFSKKSVVNYYHGAQ